MCYTWVIPGLLHLTTTWWNGYGFLLSSPFHFVVAVYIIVLIWKRKVCVDFDHNIISFGQTVFFRCTMGLMMVGQCLNADHYFQHCLSFKMLLCTSPTCRIKGVWLTETRTQLSLHSCKYFTQWLAHSLWFPNSISMLISHLSFCEDLNFVYS